MRSGEDQVALVTGGSGGLGAAIARELGGIGMPIGVHYFRGDKQAKEVVQSLPTQAVAVQADLADWESVSNMVEEVVGHLGPVTVLVNSAGVRLDALMAGQSPSEWRQVIEVNLLGTFHACRAVVPEMLRMRRGRIINVVSPAGLRGSEGQTAYSASKAGVIGLTRSLARECAKRQVTVNALSPGYMETSMTSELPDAAKERLLDMIPLRRVTTPDEVAQAVRFVLDTPYMTGQVVAIDGGMSA